MATRQFGLTVHCARQGEAEVVQGDASVLERAHLQDFIVVYEHSTTRGRRVRLATRQRTTENRMATIHQHI